MNNLWNLNQYLFVYGIGCRGFCYLLLIAMKQRKDQHVNNTFF